MPKRLLLFIPFLILGPQICLAQEKSSSPLEFFKEEVALTVGDSSSAVSGIYYFRNNTNNVSRVTIMFPFFVDSQNPYPDTIAAYVANGADTTRIDVKSQKDQDAVSLRIPLTPQGVTIWHLDYRQKILGTKATYILISTAAWGKPLEDATYRFIVPSSFADVHTWPEADSIFDNGQTREYLAHRTNFMPGQNMEVKWESK